MTLLRHEAFIQSTRRQSSSSRHIRDACLANNVAIFRTVRWMGRDHFYREPDVDTEIQFSWQ